MPDFLFVYHGGKMPETPEAQQASMAAWGKWMEDHSSALKNPGHPVGMSKTVSPAGIADDGGANPTAGFSIISADDIDAACAIAQSNPMLSDGGTIEVAPIIEM